MDTREHTLASSIVERMIETLKESLDDEDYTRIVEMSDVVLGEDEQAEDLFSLVDDGSSTDDLELDENFDDDDEEFDDEEDDEDDLSFEEDSDLEDDECDDEEDDE